MKRKTLFTGVGRVDIKVGIVGFSSWGERLGSTPKTLPVELTFMGNQSLSPEVCVKFSIFYPQVPFQIEILSWLPNGEVKHIVWYRRTELSGDTVAEFRAKVPPWPTRPYAPCPRTPSPFICHPDSLQPHRHLSVYHSDVHNSIFFSWFRIQ